MLPLQFLWTRVKNIWRNRAKRTGAWMPKSTTYYQVIITNAIVGDQHGIEKHIPRRNK